MSFKDLFDGKTKKKVDGNPNPPPEGILIPRTFTNLTEEEKNFIVETNMVPQGENGKVILELRFINIPNYGTDYTVNVKTNPFGGVAGTDKIFTLKEAGTGYIDDMGDLTEKDAKHVEKFANSIEAIDVLFHAVGFVHHGNIMHCSSEEFYNSMNINVY